MDDSKKTINLNDSDNENGSYDNDILLKQINMTPEQFQDQFGVSINQFEHDVGVSVNELLDNLNLFDDIDENGNIIIDSSLKNHNRYEESFTENLHNKNKDDDSIIEGINQAREYFKHIKFSPENQEKVEIRTLAFACELTPAKTVIPVIKCIRELEKRGQLNWKHTRIIGLYHGEGSKELIEPYCDQVFYIGQARKANSSDKGKLNLSYLIIKDIFKAVKAMMGEQIDLLITCGNAGDVRKSISAAKLLRTPVLHIEQDIYNPIEIISQSNLITVPSSDYELYLKIQYDLKNVINIGGYPMAKYVEDQILTSNLLSKEKIKEEFGFSHYILVLLGGDLKITDLNDLIPLIDGFDYPTLIAPYRFDKDYVQSLSHSPKVKILDNHVDTISLTYSADALIYGAGMGMTIEAGVLRVPSVKIYGYHPFHSSINLAKELNIPIVNIWDIPKALRKLYPPSGDLVENGQLAVYNLVNIINNFDYSLKKGNIKNTFKIWRARSKFKNSHK